VSHTSVVTVAGICNSVSGGVFFYMPPRCRWVSRLRLLNGNRRMSRLLERSLWNALIACCRRVRGCTKWDRHNGLT